MAVDRSDGRRGIGALVRELADGSATLVRDEVKLARIELGSAARGVSLGSAQIAVAAVFALLGGLSLLAGIILLIGDQWLPKDLYWLGSLIVLVASGVVTLLFLKRGLSLLSPAGLAPRQTAETLKEDKEWLKRRMTSGAT